MIAHAFKLNFEADEYFCENPPTNLTESDLLKINTGLYRVADIERVLKLPSGALRNAAHRYERQGGQPYEDWGVGNSPISHWVVRMRVFSKAWPRVIKSQIFKAPDGTRDLPTDLTPDELSKLEGIYKLSQLKGKLPFSHQCVKNQARKYGRASRMRMGCWKQGSQFYVDMQPFLGWIAKNKYA